MQWLILAGGGLILCFGFVVFFGAPYLPTLSRQVTVALELAGLQTGDCLLELGCGDGRVLLAAAERGYRAVGYELNPLLALLAWLRTRRYRGRVRVVWGNFWISQLPSTEAIFVFLLDKYMPKLHTKLMQLPPLPQQRPRRLVSFAFQMPGMTATAVREGVYMYEYK